MRRWLLALLLLGPPEVGVAQALGSGAEPFVPRTYYTFVDTAGISQTAPHVFITVIFARSENNPNSWPVSKITVSFDCIRGMVRRESHVVYKMKPDSTGVWGLEVVDSGAWTPHNPNLPTFDLVCRIGEARSKITHPLDPRFRES